MPHPAFIFPPMTRLAVGILLIVAHGPAFADGHEFAIDVMSVLSKAGCNAGTCHGNLNGKGGFKLSLRGQDPQFDHHSLVHASRGRRVNNTTAELSLFLQKATGAVAHRGGIRFSDGSPEYQLLIKWLRDGTKGPSPDAAKVIRLEVTPNEAIVVAPETQMQVRVRAFFSDGSNRDVTKRACYELSNLMAEVSPDGLVSRTEFGETTLLVRYLQQQVPIPIAFTAARPDFQWSNPPSHNEVDAHIHAKLKRLRINPSERCSDTVFVRRAYLDAIGRLPTSDEARVFVKDDHPGKRSRLIDHLLARNEFTDFWALKWADVLRAEEKVLDTKGVETFHAWIRESIASGRPVDQFVRDLVTGTGSTYKKPAANYYRANRTPSIRGETTARLFLGTRLQCAKCHNHPFDRWTQDDYYRWSSLFSQLDYDLGDNKRADKLDKNEFVGEQIVRIAKKEEVRNPQNGRVATPKFLGGDEVVGDAPDNRLASLAQWLTAPSNELFAKSQTNFIWYHVMGRGLVDPIDDFRLTNPPSNPALLDALSSDFVRSGFDLRFLVRKIMNSHTYQLSSRPNASNADDQTSFSRAMVRRLPAEVILDMQSDVLDAPAGFAGYQLGMRALQIPGVQRKRRRDEAPKQGDRFLKTFGKPQRILACECERSNETTLKQAMSLIGEGLNQRLSSSTNRLNQLLRTNLTDKQILNELYWVALSRPPNEPERLTALRMINQSSDRLATLQDITWALLNAKEFLFRR